jgi:hypothetical protein
MPEFAVEVKSGVYGRRAPAPDSPPSSGPAASTIFILSLNNNLLMHVY